ncbi:MAG: ABC transporter ATP-binding protein [endosymbiont of Escarpia spicata]|uniref:ABC transporter ATP-binding protein n=1 Tax=endosymbiont of Escarpia spicata TaxID=2200908 RepID=A0A370DPI2_9GAMM|nr:MAG: ABC transporter ATP-binding protein [endosymbiont of Escarpia spicata]
MSNNDMNQEIEQVAAELCLGIEADPKEGSTLLMGFANTYALDSRLRHSALILRLNYTKAPGDEQRRRVLDEMLDLVGDIVEDFRNGTGAEPLERAIEQAEQRYQDMAPQRDVVFGSENLGKTYPKSGFRLRGVELKLRLGEITGVVGENGNGKTTLFRLVAGDLLHDQGSMAFPLLKQESNTKKGIDWVKVKEEIAYVPQELPKVYGTLEENLQYEAAIHGILGEDNLREVGFIVERLGLGEHLEKCWSELSGGFKLRFALARALVWRPRLLIVDEPLANLDFKAQQVVLKDLRNLADGLRYPMSVLISSQHLHEVEAIADRILFLERGRVKFNGLVEQMGEQRRFNTYELGTDCEEQELRGYLRKLKLHQIQHSGVAYVITVPLEVTHRELLQLLLSEGVEVEYFRDISRSIKQLFH